jgi:hypothetical protein
MGSEIFDENEIGTEEGEIMGVRDGKWIHCSLGTKCYYNNIIGVWINEK